MPVVKGGVPNEAFSAPDGFDKETSRTCQAVEHAALSTILSAWRSDGLVTYDPACAQLTLYRDAALQQMISVDCGCRSA